MISFDTLFARYRLAWRPEPLAEELSIGQKQWKPCVPDIKLVYPLDSETAQLPVGVSAENAEAFRSAVLEFRTELPQEFAATVERFRDRQWSILILLHKYPEAIDLGRNSPALMYCLANSNEFRGTLPEMAAVQALFRSHQRQRTVLQWLGFPGTEAMARIMCKIVPEAVNASSMRALRNMVKANANVLQLLAHVPKIPEGVLALVIYGVFLKMLTPKLLAEVAMADVEQTEAPTANRLDKILALMREITPSQALKPFETIKQVRVYCDMVVTEWEAEQERRRLAELAVQRERERRDRANARRRAKRGAELQANLAAEGAMPPERARPMRMPRGAMVQLPNEVANAMRHYTREDYRQLLRQPFPPPPFPGNENIVPITHPEDLRKEGREQNHCASTYIAPVLARLSYVYKVLKPQRATVSLKRSGGKWQVEQVKGPNNTAVSVQTILTVRGWFDRVQNQAVDGNTGKRE